MGTFSSVTFLLFFVIQFKNSITLNVSFPPKSLVYSIRQNSSESPEVVYATTKEIDISAVNVTNLSVAEINKIAEGLPPEPKTVNDTRKDKGVFIVYAQSIPEVASAVPMTEEEGQMMEAQKLMSMVTEDLETDESNSHALAARSRLTPEERRKKLQMMFRGKQNTTDAPKLKRNSYDDTFEPLKINKVGNLVLTTSEPVSITDNLIENEITKPEQTTVANYVYQAPPPRHPAPQAQATFYPSPPVSNFEPPNKQFYGYVRHDLHVIDNNKGQQPQQPYLSVQQPIGPRTNFAKPGNFQGHVQHPPIQNFYPPVQNHFLPPQNFQNPQIPYNQHESFFGRIMPMFG